jgi:hypothetical protein
MADDREDASNGMTADDEANDAASDSCFVRAPEYHADEARADRSVGPAANTDMALQTSAPQPMRKHQRNESGDNLMESAPPLKLQVDQLGST